LLMCGRQRVKRVRQAGQLVLHDFILSVVNP